MFSSLSVGDAACFEPRKASASAAGKADKGLQTGWDKADFEVPRSAPGSAAQHLAGPGLALPFGPPAAAPAVQHLGEVPGNGDGERGQPRQHSGQGPALLRHGGRCALPGSPAAPATPLSQAPSMFRVTAAHTWPTIRSERGVWLPALVS